MYTKNAVIVSEAAWDALDEATQTAVMEAAEAAETRAWEMSASTTETQQATLKENGMAVAEAPEPLIEKMTGIGREMLTEWKGTASPEAIEAATPYFKSKELE